MRGTSVPVITLTSQISFYMTPLRPKGPYRAPWQWGWWVMADQAGGKASTSLAAPPLPSPLFVLL